jgi:hypothetical protein
MYELELLQYVLVVTDNDRAFTTNPIAAQVNSDSYRQVAISSLSSSLIGARISGGQHEPAKVVIQHGELVQWRNSTNVAVWAHDDYSTCCAADTISFMDLATTCTGDVRVVKKDPIVK